MDNVLCTTLEKIQNIVGCDQDFLIKQDLPLCPKCGMVLVNFDVITILDKLWKNEAYASELLSLQQRIDRVIEKYIN